MREEIKQKEEGLCCCPFCGSGIDYYIDAITEHTGKSIYIRCPNCNMAISITKERWNSRPLENNLCAERDMLTKKLEMATRAMNKSLIVTADDDGIMITTMWGILRTSLAEIATLDGKE
jgi:hypothetical protein